jgi:hypothetical protein
VKVVSLGSPEVLGRRVLMDLYESQTLHNLGEELTSVQFIRRGREPRGSVVPFVWYVHVLSIR